MAHVGITTGLKRKKREHANNPAIDNMTLCCFTYDLYSFHFSAG